MSAIEYSLYRVKMIRPPQRSFLHDPDLTPGELLAAAISERPKHEVRKNSVWRIANLRPITRTSGRFAVGRARNFTVDVLDPTTEDFMEAQLETAPFSTCIYESSIGLLAISTRPILAATTGSIARRLRDLLSHSEIATRNDIRVEIDPIRDPRDFLTRLDNAFRITEYRASFTGPNPIDADEYFQRPISVFAKKVSGTSGSVVVRGENLDRDALKDVTRSTVAVGNTAKAKIETEEGSKSQTIRLEGDAVKQRFSESTPFEVVVEELLRQYRSIRNADDQENHIDRNTVPRTKRTT